MVENGTMTAQPPRTRKPWDATLTIFLLVLFAGWVILCSFAGALVAFVGDSCGSSAECNYDLIGAALYVALFGPAVIGVIVLAVTLVRLVRKRIAFFVPIIGALLTAGVVAAAYAVASGAVVPS